MNIVLEKCNEIRDLELAGESAEAQMRVQLQINKLLFARITLLEHQVNILSGAADGLVEEIRGGRAQWRQPIWRDRG